MVELCPGSLEVDALQQRVVGQQLLVLHEYHGVLVGLARQDDFVLQLQVGCSGVRPAHLGDGLQVFNVAHGLSLCDTLGGAEAAAGIAPEAVHHALGVSLG